MSTFGPGRFPSMYIMNRIRPDIRFKDRKITKFFPQIVKQQVNGELFTLKMADVGNDQPVICVEKLMIFNI
jgi:hypothetical protein